MQTPHCSAGALLTLHLYKGKSAWILAFGKMKKSADTEPSRQSVHFGTSKKEKSAVGKPQFVKTKNPADTEPSRQSVKLEPRERFNSFCQLRNLKKKNRLKLCLN